MVRHPSARTAALSALLALCAIGACSPEDLPQPEPPATTTTGTTTTTTTQAPEPRVTVAGGHGVEVGKSLQLAAATADGIDSGYAWHSEDEKIATVDQSGLVTGVLPGETAILATGADTGAVGEHALVVVAGPPPPEPVVTISGGVLVDVGASVQLAAKTENGEDSAYAWSSSDDAVAAVDAQGLVTGKSPGEVSVTATGADTGTSGHRDLVVAAAVPDYDDWKSSGHANYQSEAFNHWNLADPKQVPAACARCHSTPGFMDYLGADGSPAFAVDKPAPIGTVIECQACHNDEASSLSTVVFPGTEESPGVQLGGLGSAEARCLTCHQGRESAATVNEAIAKAGVKIDDEVSDKLGFQNVHYLPAGAIRNGGRVAVGYQYAGRSYDWRFRHVPGKDGCTDCHDPHSLQVRVDECASCHAGASKLGDLKNIRMMSSLARDYDGDGDRTEGMGFEIDGLQAKLLAAIQAYPSALQPATDKICYDAASYPPWFADTNGNGQCDGSEASPNNNYAKWTPRLVRAAYNYHLSRTDPGGYAHNAKYVAQLLYDSIVDLDVVLESPQLGAAERVDPGHFDGSAEASRHWDKDGGVAASCATCHGGAEGLLFYVNNAVSIKTSEPGNGLECGACHADAATAPPGKNAIAVPSVTFPASATAAAKITLDLGGTSNLCGTCHAGRVAKADIDAAIAAQSFKFLNVHYLPAAALWQGSKAAVGYQYPGKSYGGAREHKGGSACVFCHRPDKSRHSFDVQDTFAAQACDSCHGNADSAHEIRWDNTDYDGDKDGSEPLGDEVDTIAAALLAGMHGYAVKLGKPVCYDGAAYPYFFADKHDVASGACHPADAVANNSFKGWDGALMKAAHNYQLSRKEPGAWAHNLKYMLQLLIDSVDDLEPGAAAAAGFVRPG
ncbi:MAG: Ig-like domain-containing protein [Deltaproteobacteria bacterium]|nr:Ig-like domain-containing protein [Deltaproteobacteria bacterium]